MLKKLRSPLGCAIVSGLLLVVGLCLWDLYQGGDHFLGEVALADGEHRLRLLKTVEGPLDYSWRPSLINTYLLGRGQYVSPFEVHLDGIEEWHSKTGQTFLFRTVDSEGRYANSAGPIMRYEFVESTGFVFRPWNSSVLPDQEFSQWDTHASTRFALPRRDKELRIRIYEGTQTATEPLEMVIPNPCYRTDFPQWQPETLPIQKTKGPLTVQLKSFELSWNGRLHPKFEATSLDGDLGRPEYDFMIEDATGNLGESLSPYEPVWKLKTYAHQSQSAEFPKKCQTAMGKFPLLAPGTVTPLNRLIKIGEVECRLLCVAGPGVVRETGGEFTAKQIEKPEEERLRRGWADSSSWKDGQTERWVLRETPFVWIELPTKLPPHNQIIVQANQDGQRTRCPVRPIFTNQRSFIVAELPTNSSSKEVDLTLVLSRPVEFEFFVTPPAAAREELVKPPSKK